MREPLNERFVDFIENDLKTLVTVDREFGDTPSVAFRRVVHRAVARVKSLDRKTTGAVLGSIPAPGDGGDSGLAWAEGTLWVGQHRGRKIHQVDPETGKVLRTIESDRFVTGVTWVDGELWHGTWQAEQSDVRRIDPETGEVLECLEMPTGTGVSGLESDGGDRFFCGGGSSGKVRAIRRPKRAPPKRAP